MTRAILDEVMLRFDSFSELETNWDSYGGVPSNPDSIMFAKMFSIMWEDHYPFDESMEVFPEGDGIILVELANDDCTREATVEFYANGELRVMFITQSAETKKPYYFSILCTHNEWEFVIQRMGAHLWGTNYQN